MFSRLQVPDNLEEQDIGSYYHSRGSSPAFSDTDTPSLVSRPTSQVQFDALPDSLHGSSRPPSVAYVAEVKQDGLSVYQPLQRSSALPRLPSTMSASGFGRASSEGDSPSFAFPAEKIQKMHEWALAFVVVQFDLDLGPAVLAVHPPVYLSSSERENIAFSSFPDSLQFEQGSEVHSFRIRVYPNLPGAPAEDVHEQLRPPSVDGFMYGFSHFYQKRDPTSKRGYQQSSLVLLSRHQYPALYTSMISQLGPLFYKHGVTMLETACHNIASWYVGFITLFAHLVELPDAKERRSPIPGATLELGFLGSMLHVELPLHADSQQLAETSSFSERFNPSVHLLASSGPFDPPPIQLFEASLSHLWSLWECLVLSEPMLVFGPSPAMTSQAVWWLRDLIRPIPLAADVRPYFTIHDKDHTLLVNKAPPKAGLVLGVTNPFFERACAHWPHVLRVGRKSQGKNGVVAGPAPGWTTKTHRRYISKDRTLLRALERACAGSGAEQLQASLDLRRHFHARTDALLVPLNRYLNMRIPSPSERHAGQARLKPFSTTDFMASLHKSPLALPFKSGVRQKEFYERWLRSPAFGVWLARQEEVVGAVLCEKT